MLRNKFGFTNIRTKRTGLNLRCEVQRFKRKCKFAGIYLKSNGCLYTRGEHEHEDIEKVFYVFCVINSHITKNNRKLTFRKS
jgi:hypothetical protein